MTSTAEPAAQRSNWAPLLLAATGSGLLGLALGWRLAQQQAKQQRRSKPRLVYGAKLGPAATPRSVPPAPAHGAGLRMVLLVRTDAALTPKELAEQSARVMLGMFKKQYKRRDPNLRLWEEGGSRIKVIAAASQNDMLMQQSAARALAIPTHTYAGADRESKQRTVMVIGPAPSGQLEMITQNLPDLA
ncbi:peptidyl-tRNA hydrolase 2 [Micractinium conductrix]|uniref:peptidyl-tRNA hydrolase n=1 Tax=Micractinium conductrix TaxID=554055 RepID=A0A2P6UZD2_9CHLO|nr:peptidyl-tRNA hydrolase 2 [Micractinium conductrix]|eukprot:PSC67208.1 peptidyl-tRNA hydrolase 2 [Micractinium conductrix]